LRAFSRLQSKPLAKPLSLFEDQSLSGKQAPKTLSCTRPLRHAVCGRFLPSDIAPPLVRWCSWVRSLGCRSLLSGSCRRHIVTPWQPLPSLCFRRSSRAPWSPLLASLSSYVVMPTARSSLVRSGVVGWGERSHLLPIGRLEWSPTHACAFGASFWVLWFVGVLVNRPSSEQDQPPSSVQFKGVLLPSQCASPHSRSARPFAPHRSLRHHVRSSLTSTS
jgi:hypothetical protein